MWGLIALAAVGLAAMIIELFVPAGGVIGLVGLGSIVAAIVKAYGDFGTAVGTIFLVASLIIVPTLFVLYFSLFSRTFMGKRLILASRQQSEEGFSNEPQAASSDLPGKQGVAETPLRPAGTVKIEGRRFSAVTFGDFLEQGSAVEVKRVEGNRIVVSAARPES
jgi:membrane-bound serine protease (ClpP class)